MIRPASKYLSQKPNNHQRNTGVKQFLAKSPFFQEQSLEFSPHRIVATSWILVFFAPQFRAMPLGIVFQLVNSHLMLTLKNMTPFKGN